MGKKFEFEEKQIPYDRRSSVFVDVGSSYGTGKRQPVGSEKVKHGYDPAKGVYFGRLDESKEEEREHP